MKNIILCIVVLLLSCNHSKNITILNKKNTNTNNLLSDTLFKKYYLSHFFQYSYKTSKSGYNLNYDQFDIENLYLEYKNQIIQDSIKKSDTLNKKSFFIQKKLESNQIDSKPKLEDKKESVFLPSEKIINKVILKDKLINYNDNKYNVIFYCPKSLKEGETERISVSISKLDSNIIKENIIQFINDERKQKSQPLISKKDLEQKNINLLDSVKVDLIDPSGRIKIINDNQLTWRKVDLTNQEWYWYLTPNKDEGGKSPVSIYLNISTKDNSNILTKPFVIKIDLPETIWQAFLRKLRDIGWIITILGSIIGFFIGKKNK